MTCRAFALLLPAADHSINVTWKARVSRDALNSLPLFHLFQQCHSSSQVLSSYFHLHLPLLSILLTYISRSSQLHLDCRLPVILTTTPHSHIQVSPSHRQRSAQDGALGYPFVSRNRDINHSKLIALQDCLRATRISTWCTNLKKKPALTSPTLAYTVQLT